MAADTIFSKIIRGDIPSHKVYEDEFVFAIMDIHPIQPGQVLIISKVPEDHFMDLPQDAYNALFSAVREIARRLREVYPDKARIGVMIEGLEVPHAHVKVFPFSDEHEYRNIPDMTQEPDHQALAETARKLYNKE